MRYDDRLATVLRLVPGGSHVARIQYRQLLDLLGTAPAEVRDELSDTAFVRLAELSARIPASERAAMLGEPGLRLRSPRLLASLAADERPVARAAIAAARLAPEQWQDLIPALSPAARMFLAGRDDIGAAARALLARLGAGNPALPSTEVEATRPGPDVAPTVMTPAVVAPAVVATPAVPPETPEPPESGAIDGIGAIVRRIEAFRRQREASGATPATDAPRLPLGEESSAPQILAGFDIASDPEGRIVAADALVAPMVVGLELAEFDALRLPLRRRQPVRAARLVLTGAPAISGAWQLDASPRFEPLGGRFLGYVGRFRRPAAQPAPTRQPDSESDRLRQLLHELRTPVNAIQGFAEIIQQQLFGPAPHEYRALAAAIAADAAHMLAGFEELERYARLEASAMELAAGESDLAETLGRLVTRLEPQLAARGAGILLTGAEALMPVPLSPIETERLCWRLMATLAAQTADGEQLTARLAAHPPHWCLDVTLPAALADCDDEALFQAAPPAPADTPSAGMFGTGFALRLATVEARAAEGCLSRENGHLRLTLPGLTGDSANHSLDDESRARVPDR